MMEFVSDVLFNKLLVALVIGYPLAAVWFFHRLRQAEEREKQSAAPSSGRPAQ